MLAEDIVSIHWHVPLPTVWLEIMPTEAVLYETSIVYMDFDHDMMCRTVSCMQHACVYELHPAGNAMLYSYWLLFARQNNCNVTKLCKQVRPSNTDLRFHL